MISTTNPLAFNPPNSISKSRTARAAAAPKDQFQRTGSQPISLGLIPRGPVPAPAAKLTGRVLERGDAGWDDACVHFCGRIDAKSVEPKSIVFVQNAQDVKNALRFAQQTETPLRVRCGRHSYEAYSMVKDGLVIDVSDMNQIQIDAKNGQVTVGAGCRVHDIAEALAAEGRVMPLPTFPSVGISGATLGGGVGLTSRKYGMTCDNLVSAKVVTAEGREITVSDSENPDLLWALKGGGGGNFGVVTSFTFQTHPVQNVAAFQASWGWDQFDTLVDAWQKWAPNADDRISPVLCLRADGKINLYGQFTPDSNEDLDDCQKVLNELFAQVPPQSSGVTPVPPNIASRMFGQIDPSSADWKQSLRKEQTFKSTSAIAFQPIPKEGIEKLRHYLENSPRRAGEFNENEDMVQLLPGGGATARKACDETGVYHRQAQYILQYDGYWQNPEDEKANTEWVEGMRNGMMDYAHGAYVNYHDSNLKDPLIAYYGPNLAKLVEVKQAYDPNNLFNYPQSIPTQLTPEQQAACLASKPVAAAYRGVCSERGLA